ncbi:MAG: MFS transporter, partial [Alphaproteobacteria bacterium]|nr:MFS transporter [Alphaproteobacteria bacterium]
AVHLPAFLADEGLSPMVGATALGVIGLFNIVSGIMAGVFGDKFRKKFTLSWLYIGRAVVISGFLFFAITEVSALVFAAAIGLLWLGTVPLTSALVAEIFGPRYLSTLFGFVFFSHQVGSFLGAWLGGYVYDLTGSYTPVWLAAIALSVIAALLHMPIADQPVARLAKSTA